MRRRKKTQNTQVVSQNASGEEAGDEDVSQRDRSVKNDGDIMFDRRHARERAELDGKSAGPVLPGSPAVHSRDRHELE
jgi:hypothetical protein